MNENIECYLLTMLECGTDDFSLLDDVNFDIGDIVVNLLDDGIKPTLAEILREAFAMAVDNIAEDHQKLLEETEQEFRIIGDPRKKAHKECKARLNDLKSMNPRRDIQFEFNYLCSEVKFEDNEELYHKYLQKSLDDAENDFGWPF